MLDDKRYKSDFPWYPKDFFLLCNLLRCKVLSVYPCSKGSHEHHQSIKDTARYKMCWCCWLQSYVYWGKSFGWWLKEHFQPPQVWAYSSTCRMTSPPSWNTFQTISTLLCFSHLLWSVFDICLVQWSTACHWSSRTLAHFLKDQTICCETGTRRSIQEIKVFSERFIEVRRWWFFLRDHPGPNIFRFCRRRFWRWYPPPEPFLLGLYSQTFGWVCSWQCYWGF